MHAICIRQLVLIMIHIATDSCLLNYSAAACMVAIMLLGASSNIINVTFVIACINISCFPEGIFYDGASTIDSANRARTSVYFLRKTKMADGRFSLVFRRALLG